MGLCHVQPSLKGKIKRKAHALRRWQMKKGLPGEKAAKGFIHKGNYRITYDQMKEWGYRNLVNEYYNFTLS